MSKAQWEQIERARQRKMSKMAADIQKVLRKDLRIQELEGKMVVGREEAAGLTSCHG